MAVTTSGKDKLLKHTRFYVGGYDLSGDARTFSSLDNSYGEVDFTGWNETVINFLADGRQVVGIRGFQALMNDASGGSYDQLGSASNSLNTSMCFGGGGEPAAGDPAYLLPAVQISDTAGLEGAAGILQADFLPEAGTTDADIGNPMGVVLRGPTSLSATLTASSANSHDYGGSTASGWHAIIHVIASSSGNFAFKIRDSADDSAWADLGSFTVDGSAVTSEYISGSGDVDRYVAFDANRTGGTCTVIVTFARGLPVNQSV
jgi:hypothetical protein